MNVVYDMFNILIFISASHTLDNINNNNNNTIMEYYSKQYIISD
jgi:hypothetical protein